MIDLAEVEPGKFSKGIKNLTANEWYFPVHFPEEPMVPGMIQMEALLQTLSLTVLTVEENNGKLVRGNAAKKIRLKKRVVPGNVLNIETELLAYDGIKASGYAKGYVDSEEVCYGEFSMELIEP
jgi:3-hydroxyacyl-[acyl-carrier-protein] dehydratase